jgi:hypothetical protein
LKYLPIGKTFGVGTAAHKRETAIVSLEESLHQYLMSLLFQLLRRELSFVAFYNRSNWAIFQFSQTPQHLII